MNAPLICGPSQTFPGYWCSRTPGHDGPCALRLSEITFDPLEICPRCKLMGDVCECPSPFINAEAEELIVANIPEVKLYLSPTLTAKTERMSDQFLKVHLQVGKSPITLHHFTGPDTGPAHDHPFPFTTTVLRGGYAEEVWRLCKGQWVMQRRHWPPGSTHYVGDGEVHRIVDLPHGECVTSITWHDEGRKRQEPNFYEFSDHGRTVRMRQWDQKEWMEFKR